LSLFLLGRENDRLNGFLDELITLSVRDLEFVG
jgi:hypothetical protein